jgi:hypothetical protein
MDVLTGLVSSLGTTSDDEYRLRFTECLSQRRFATAKKLHSVVDKHRNSASECLRRCSMAIAVAGGRRRDFLATLRGDSRLADVDCEESSSFPVSS